VLYDELYGDWDRVEREVAVHANAWTGRARERAVEVLWSNRPIRTWQQLQLEAEVPA
jgi:hypothetical protein